MAEHLSGAHQVEHLAVIDDFHRPRADHAQKLDRSHAFRKYCLSLSVEFDLYNCAEQFERVGIESGEGGKFSEKLNYVWNSRQSDLLAMAFNE
jgi:hypothetical protein